MRNSKLNLIWILILGITTLGHGQALDNIESIEYDSLQSRYLISNNNSILSRDSTGRLTFFGDGAVAEYGMEIMEGLLYTIAGNQVHVYWVDNGTKLTTIDIPGAHTLNGMTHDNDGNIYVTDFVWQKIFKIDANDPENAVVTELVENIGTQINGIVYDPVNHWLVFVNWETPSSIRAVALEGNELVTIARTSLGQCDGITRDWEGNFFVACWSPQSLTKFDAQFTQPGELITTTPPVNNPGDIAFNPHRYEVAVANSGNRTLTFAPFEKPWFLPAKEIPVQKSKRVTISKNKIHWHQAEIKDVSIELFNVSGKQTRVLLKKPFRPGNHSLPLPSSLKKGEVFILKLNLGKHFEILKFITGL